MFRKILLILSILFFLLLLLGTGATLYLRKFFDHKQVLSLARKMSQQYLNRDISFEQFRFNIFQGLVLKKIVVLENPGVKHSARFTIDELNLRYDFSRLLSGKLYFSHITLADLELEVDPLILRDEIQFYRQRFSGTNKSTNRTRAPAPGERRVLLKTFEVKDSAIKYMNGQYLLQINRLSFQSGKMAKVKNDLSLFFQKHRADLEGEVYLFGKNATINWDVEMPRDRVFFHLSSQTSNLVHFVSEIDLRWKEKPFHITAVHSWQDQRMAFDSLHIRDFRNNVFTVQNGVLDLKRSLARFHLVWSMKEMDNRYLEELYPFRSFPFQADYNADLDVSLNLKQMKDWRLSGILHLDSLALTLGTNTFHILNSDLKIKNNDGTINNGTISYRDSLFHFNLSKQDLADLSRDILLSFTVDRFQPPFPSFPLVYRLESSLVLRMKKKQVQVNDFSCETMKGRVSGKGMLEFREPVIVRIEPVLKGIRLEDVMGLLKNEGKITGVLDAKGLVEFRIKDRKIVPDRIEGQVSSSLDYGIYKDIVLKTSLEYSDGILYFKNGVCGYNRNDLPFTGTYSLGQGLLTLSGSGSLNLNTFLRDPFRGQLDYQYSLSKDVRDPEDLSLAITFSGPEAFYDFFRFSDLKGDLSIASNSLKSRVAVNNFYNGIIKADLSGDMKRKDLSLQAAGTKINVTEPMKHLIDGTITGRVDFNLALKTKGTNRSGTLDLTILKGEITDTMYQKQIGGFLSVMKEKLDDIFYDRISAQIRIEDEILSTKRLDIVCPDQVHNLSGEYHMRSHYVNADINLKMDELFVSDVSNPILVFVFKKKDNWYILKPLVIQGVIGKDAKVQFK